VSGYICKSRRPLRDRSMHDLFVHQDLKLTCRQQEMVQYSPVPVLNALSSLWHPTQILADMLTLHEHAEAFAVPSSEDQADATIGKEDAKIADDGRKEKRPFFTALPTLRPLTIAYLGDSTNVLHDMLVTYPRFGHKIRVATPPDAKYQCPEPVWSRVKQLECAESISWSADPREAVKGADVIVTDTWLVFAQTMRLRFHSMFPQDLYGPGSRESPTHARFPRLPSHGSPLP
jgi:ornithine carbamoyltransferase